MPFHILILGGTTEASALARALAADETVAPVLSLAGRTQTPALPPVPFRVGGFGGVAGLVDHLIRDNVQAVVDATHPFAAQISVHAADACARLHRPLARFTRPPWRPEPDDRWTTVPDLASTVPALGDAPRRIFLTSGRLGLAVFRAAPQHHYLIRTIDPPEPGDLPPDSTVILARPPFAAADEIDLMRSHGIDLLVTKNSGGDAGRAKIEAARRLGLPVIVVDRPAPSGRVPSFSDLDAVLRWITAQRTAPPVAAIP